MQSRRLHKFLIGTVSLMILSGCQTGESNDTPTTRTAPAAVQTQPPPPAPSPEPEEEEQRFLAEVLIGASTKSLEASLGEPDIVFAEQKARFLRYDAPGCAVHILMEDGTVIEVTPRKRNGRPLAKQAADDCFHEMVKRRRAQTDDD